MQGLCVGGAYTLRDGGLIVQGPLILMVIVEVTVVTLNIF
jgi:hypothetical protein